MAIDKSTYPHLFEERVYPWGPLRIGFELNADPPEELISNVNIVPYVGDEWLIIRQGVEWGITGGTLEPGETYMEAIRRELREEAGARLIHFTPFGAWRCYSLADKPYRPHLPFPEFYRILGYGEVEIVGEPENPEDGEHVDEVAVLPLQEACRRLLSKKDNGRMLAEAYRLAAEVKELGNACEEKE